MHLPQAQRRKRGVLLRVLPRREEPVGSRELGMRLWVITVMKLITETHHRELHASQVQA